MAFQIPAEYKIRGESRKLNDPCIIAARHLVQAGSFLVMGLDIVTRYVTGYTRYRDSEL